MARIAKKLYQGALSSTIGAKYTVPSSTKAQICEIWLANTGSSARTVTLATHGTAASNYIANAIPLAAGQSVVLDDLKIILSASEYIAAKQDSGTDVTMTVYGIEET